MTEPNAAHDKESQHAKTQDTHGPGGRPAKRRANSPPNNWEDNFHSVSVSAEDAIGHIRPGQRVFIGTACGQPQTLVKALLDRAGQLEGTEIVHLLTLANPSFHHKELAENFRLNSFFIVGNIDQSIEKELGDYTPILLSEIPHLFRSGKLPLDVALIQVTPPNEQGMCSLGVSVDIVKSAAENAALVIAEVNPHMPWTMGDSLLSIHDIDILVHSDCPLLEAELPRPTKTSRRIARYIAALTEDGATLELGADSISVALPDFLKDKHDLGIHTNTLSDAVIALAEPKVVTGSRKKTDHRKIVASMCMGTHKLYDYIDNNPDFSFRPTEYVSDSYLISRQYKMVAINTALEIDLTGQVCADSLETKFFRGLSNQADFTHGVARCPGGKLIVAMDSARSDETISRIVAHLTRGAGVAATCSEAHYVVTEFGVAYLHGKSLQERALALISIAHPKFRAQLLKEAIKDNYVSPDLAAIEGKILVGPRELRTSFVLEDGTQINFRPMQPTDEKRMHVLFHSLSQQTLYYRFMSHMTRMPQKQIQDFVYTDYRSEMAIVGTIPEAHGEDIIATGRYYLNQQTNRAEVAFLVRDKWQNQGIGTFLLKYLITIAKRNGIAGFTAEVLPTNKPMLAVFNKSSYMFRSRLKDDVCHLELDFA